MSKVDSQSPNPTSKNRVSAFTAGEWASVGLLDKLVPLADYERLRAALETAWTRMDRARNILTNGNPTPECNWGMLDTRLDRAALSAEPSSDETVADCSTGAGGVTLAQMAENIKRGVDPYTGAETLVERRLAEACEYLRRGAAIVAMAGDQTMATRMHSVAEQLLGDMRPWAEPQGSALNGSGESV